MEPLWCKERSHSEPLEWELTEFREHSKNLERYFSLKAGSWCPLTDDLIQYVWQWAQESALFTTTQVKPQWLWSSRWFKTEKAALSAHSGWVLSWWAIRVHRVPFMSHCLKGLSVRFWWGWACCSSMEGGNYEGPRDHLVLHISSRAGRSSQFNKWNPHFLWLMLITSH